MVKVLYNPLGHNKNGRLESKKIAEFVKGDVVVFDNITAIEDPYDYICNDRCDKIVISGGDGTLNRFVNSLAGRELPVDIYYFPAGSGNDFDKDVKTKENEFYKINDYIRDLPTVVVKGESYKFLNGIGYGIDGYCCEVGDRMRAREDNKPINYTAIAIKGLLFHFRPSNATVTVDGVEYKYKKVWLAPIMNGRFYGGGMMIAPNQDRLDQERKLTTVVVHGCGKLKILTVFPKIFKGEHISHTDIIAIHEGHDISVSFSRPTACQVDGETILGVSTISATKK